MMQKAFIGGWVFATVLASFLTGCGPEGGQEKARSEVVVYCSVDVAFAEPILKAFEERSGIKVHWVFDTEAGKTTGLVNKLLAEKDRPRADVWWSSEIFGTMQLVTSGVLTPYNSPVAADIPAMYRDEDGMWTATGLRGRVIAYDPKRTKPEDLPQRWCDLIDPKYKGRFRIADPRFGTTRGHMAVQLSLWGRPAMEAFYSGLLANDCKLADGNAQAVLLLSRAVTEFVATDTDDVIVAQERGDSVEMIYPDLDAPEYGEGARKDSRTSGNGEGARKDSRTSGNGGGARKDSRTSGNGGGARKDSRTSGGSGEGARRDLRTSGKVPGTLWIPCSVGLVRGGPNPETGKKLVDYLISAEVEEKLYASESRNVPVRPSLREKLKAKAPNEATVDYQAAADLLDLSDQLARDMLLK